MENRLVPDRTGKIAAARGRQGAGWQGVMALLAACSVVLLALAGAGCQLEGRQASSPKVTISLAASAQEPLAELAQRFAQQRGIRVELNTGASSSLANQIVAGAPADLFLSASKQWSDEVAAAGLVVDSCKLVTNRMVLVVPRGNPAGVRDAQELLEPAVRRVALAGENVPAGIYAEQALRALGVLEPLMRQQKIARGQDVRSTLAYVERGEAEAAVVYATDAAAAVGVEIVHEFDPSTHDRIAYVLVRLAHGKQNAAAGEFFDFLASPAADEVFRKHGFERIRD
jgi:molybdate transport system substrate-binding protein